MATGSLLSTSLGTGFRQFLLTLYPDPSERHDQARWADSLIRWLRYQYLWGFYDQSIYWGYYSELIKREFGLYKNIRTILSSVTRLVEFHVTHNMGGRLDREAGNGKIRPSALPIILGKDADKSVQTMIAQLWAVSRWQVQKSSFVRFGTALGDVGLELVDDAERKQIRMRVVHPGEIKAATFDPYGNVTSCFLERFERDPEDPEGDLQSVYGMRVAVLENGTVHYETFRNESPYAWPGSRGSEWDSELTFIPIFLLQHIDQGFAWGVSEIGSLIPKTMELDDAGCNSADAQCRMVNGPWLLTGATLLQSQNPPSPWAPDPFSPPTNLGNNFYQIRSAQIQAKQDMPIIECTNENAKMTPLSFPVPIAEVVQFLQFLQQSMKDDFPEFDVDNAQATGSASGRALRVQRQKATAKIDERRTPYEEILAKAQTASLAMGGIFGYPGYQAFNEKSLTDGKADHHIGDRAVFPVDPLDTVEITQARANAAKTWVEVGLPVRAALMQLDFPPDDLDTIDDMIQAEDEREYAKEQERIDAMMAKQEAIAAAGQDTEPGVPSGINTGPENAAPPEANGQPPVATTLAE